MKTDMMLTQCNHKYFLYEEKEDEILSMINKVRRHLKEDQLKLNFLKNMPSFKAKDLQEAVGTAIVNSHLRLAYLQSLLFDVRVLKTTTPFVGV